jgi:hypothetical protein
MSTALVIPHRSRVPTLRHSARLRRSGVGRCPTEDQATRVPLATFAKPPIPTLRAPVRRHYVSMIEVGSLSGACQRGVGRIAWSVLAISERRPIDSP